MSVPPLARACSIPCESDMSDSMYWKGERRSPLSGHISTHRDLLKAVCPCLSCVVVSCLITVLRHTRTAASLNIEESSCPPLRDYAREWRELASDDMYANMVKS